jgi:hypothetical protein
MDHDDGQRVKDFQHGCPSDDREDDDEPRRHKLPPAFLTASDRRCQSRAPRGQQLLPVV